MADLYSPKRLLWAFAEAEMDWDPLRPPEALDPSTFSGFAEGISFGDFTWEKLAIALLIGGAVGYSSVKGYQRAQNRGASGARSLLEGTAAGAVGIIFPLPVAAVSALLPT